MTTNPHHAFTPSRLHTITPRNDARTMTRDKHHTYDRTTHAPGATPSRVRPHRARGLTLVELMLAVAGTSLVGAAVAAMLVAVNAGSNTDNDMRGSVIRHQAAAARIQAAIRGSTLVLGAGEDWIMLWTYDLREDASPNLSELRLIERNAQGQVHSYQTRWPDAWDEQTIDLNDTAYPLDADWASLRNTLKAIPDSQNPYFAPTLWFTDAQSLAFSFADPNVQLANVVGFRITLRVEQLPHDVIGAAALRN